MIAPANKSVVEIDNPTPNSIAAAAWPMAAANSPA